jgi:diguanylate cyclase (GGDEF)-like protein
MAEQGSLMLLDRDDGALRLAAQKGSRIADDVRVPAGEGIAGKVAAQGEPLLVEDVERDPRVLQKNRGRYRTPSFISVPLKIGDQLIGVLNFADKVTGEVFDQEDLQLILSFATHAALVLERNELYQQTEQLRSLSSTDPLTGVLNRRAFQERFDEEVDRAKRHGRPLSLLMMDIDRFKAVNDRHGHQGGDHAIKLVADSVQKAVRSIDIVARFGGDEFVVILPETGPARARLIGERIRREVEGRTVPWQNSTGRTTLGVTVSIGAATGPQDGETAAVLLERADRGLYQAKSLGRNRVAEA